MRRFPADFPAFTICRLPPALGRTLIDLLRLKFLTFNHFCRLGLKDTETVFSEMWVPTFARRITGARELHLFAAGHGPPISQVLVFGKNQSLMVLRDLEKLIDHLMNLRLAC
jgi:hypothetical protein